MNRELNTQSSFMHERQAHMRNEARLSHALRARHPDPADDLSPREARSVLRRRLALALTLAGLLTVAIAQAAAAAGGGGGGAPFTSLFM